MTARTMDPDTQVTAAGRVLAEKLSPAIGTTQEILQTCSLIARHARTHNAHAEYECNGYRRDGDDRAASVLGWDRMDAIVAERQAWSERRVERIEQRITALVASLPEYDTEQDGRGRFGVRFSGDPRGWTVRLTGPESLYDGWGRDGIGVEIGR